MYSFLSSQLNSWWLTAIRFIPARKPTIENPARIFHLRVRRARIITNPMRRKWSYLEFETEHVPLRIPS